MRQIWNTLRKELDLNKALFLLDLLQVGKRKYTQLRQNLLCSEIDFPAYRKVVEHIYSMILWHLIQPYPTVVNPIGMHVPYAQYVRAYIPKNYVNVTASIIARFSLAIPDSRWIRWFWESYSV